MSIHISSGQRTRQKNIQYFFIKDRVDTKEEVNIVYCLTEHMVGDFFTMPLQEFFLLNLEIKY